MPPADETTCAWAATGAHWRRWEPVMETIGWPLALRMAAVAEVGAATRVLDVGCGIGDPTLQVAVLTGPHGRVLGIDVDAATLATARARAEALGLTNVEFVAADVRTMALEPNAFDVVLGRWSLTFLPEAAEVMARLRDTLVPGGRIAVAGWAPPDANPWITVPADVLAEATGRPRVPVEVSDGFNLSADGELARALVSAGFQAVGQERVVLSYVARDVREFWEALTAVGPLGPSAGDLDDATRERVLRELDRRLARHRSSGVLRVPAQAQLAWGRA
jgi:SAM-dependent methyltransferase